MPYTDEHSCRLIAPAEFDEFRRQNSWRQVDGKRVDAIWGINNEGTALQAMRYPKDIWTSSDARSHCSAQDGIVFEPAIGPEIREDRMAHVTKFIRPDLKIVDKAAGVINAVVSTEAMDRDGDIIRQDAWDLEHFKAHPILLSSHNYRGLTNQIGEWTSMKVVDGKLVGEAKYYIKSGNQEADGGFLLASKGRAAFSVGFVPDMSKAKQIDSNGNLSYEFQGQELLEVSQVTVPSNAEALQSLKGIGLHPELDSIVTEMLDDMGPEKVAQQVLRRHVESAEPIQAEAEERKSKKDMQVALVFGEEWESAAFAKDVADLVIAELKELAKARQDPATSEGYAPSARDIVRQVMENYNGGR